MIASECGRGCPGVTTQTRAPRVGVANATSTSRETSCTPTSTPSSWHCTYHRRAARPPHRTRPATQLSDAELICLAVAQVLLGFNTERRWLRFADHRLGHLFPYLPSASAYNRRLRRAAPGRPCHPGPGRAHPNLRRPAAPGRPDPGAVCGRSGDRPPVGVGRPCRLWLLQEPASLLLGLPAVCAGRPRRPPRRLVPGHPQAGRT
jgi:hypothetical protein